MLVFGEELCLRLPVIEELLVELVGVVGEAGLLGLEFVKHLFAVSFIVFDTVLALVELLDALVELFFVYFVMVVFPERSCVLFDGVDQGLVLVFLGQQVCEYLPNLGNVSQQFLLLFYLYFNLLLQNLNSLPQVFQDSQASFSFLVLDELLSLAVVVLFLKGLDLLLYIGVASYFFHYLAADAFLYDRSNASHFPVHFYQLFFLDLQTFILIARRLAFSLRFVSVCVLSLSALLVELVEFVPLLLEGSDVH